MVKKKDKKNKKKVRKKNMPRACLLPQIVWSKIFALFLWILASIFLLSFFKAAGVGGDYLLRAFIFLIGKVVYSLPLILALIGFFVFKSRHRQYFLTSCLGFLFLILGTTGILAVIGGDQRMGGMLGFLLTWPFIRLFGFWISQFVFLAVVAAGIIVFWHLFWKKSEKETQKKLEYAPPGIKEKEETKEDKRINIKKPFFSKIKIKKNRQKIDKTLPELGAVIQKKKEEGQKRVPFYPLSLLECDKEKPNSGDINKNSIIIKNTLENFEIPVEMKGVNIGPTVTQYTLKPAEGIRLSKITALNNDLALALANHPIRIEAPIPGRSLVGIEIPNKFRAQVHLRNLLEKSEFQGADARLLFVLGRDVAGSAIFADLSRMPHLLVAGSTGSGKTIFLNSLILSLLQKNTPETLRFILIDPKRVEFSLYQELVYLLGSVIFEPNRAIFVIRWLIDEMEKRFRILSSAGVRNIANYNQRATGRKEEIMPYIVLIIDELADLMAAKGREVEAGIVRLAQLSRAVGIHLVLATQRPSVEVLTGLIKANITSRITFQVATQVDSRTVLDMAGAEKLLGYGDMLFLSAQTPRPKRIQAPFVSGKEVKKIITWQQKHPNYLTKNFLNFSLSEKISQEIEEAGTTARQFSSDGQIKEDVLCEEAKKVVIEARKASASLLQRRLRIGYARAARLLDILEARGVVGPANGAKPRAVYGARTEQEGESQGDSPHF